ncbi:type II toxin-antitoxin system YafQ family toxin [Pyramidobacter piscolens]|uniref:type II toxin-antitoxin system YafQ family toxin n=1 Tax=Pyramidobacter piscolens TaxID=638849 RepID=UPI001E375865|nr:type II toxin-antitoxin system YafQ family toxin [Pyramidobacter piscolens]
MTWASEMLHVEFTAQFRKDRKRMEKRGADMGKLREAILILAAEEELPPRSRDHGLTGEWRGSRDLHLEPDWALIYEIRGDVLGLVRTGSHADLFDK